MGLWVETLGPSRIICTCLLLSGNKIVAFIKDSDALWARWHSADSEYAHSTSLAILRGRLHSWSREIPVSNPLRQGRWDTGALQLKLEKIRGYGLVICTLQALTVDNSPFHYGFCRDCVSAMVLG